jgi:hypothetical protein
MNGESAVFAHDLMILEEMAGNMAAYLDSDAVEWTIPRANMPKLTIGGYLMRQSRLGALREALSSDEQERLDAATDQYDKALEERVVRFEKRANQELHMRITEWVGFLREISHWSNNEVNTYAGGVDTRVVIKELLDALQTPPYRLEPGVLDELNAIDNILRGRIAEDGFVWDSVWEPAYPEQEFWWLYGKPREN